MSYSYTNEDIFISIPSYRDDLCINTVKDIYLKANNPENIYCGIFTQVDHTKKEESCYDESFPYNVNIRRLLIDYKEAKGPLWARIQIIKNLYQNEKYVLMIDAHTTFEKDWDSKLKLFLNTLKTKKNIKKPILSGYPADRKHKTDNTFLNCGVKSGNKYPLAFQAHIKPPGYYYKTYFIAAGCVFTYGDYFIKIKSYNDLDTLQYIFQGEEMLLSLLAYVNNYDIYSIPHSVLYHYYRITDKEINSKSTWIKHSNVDEKIKSESYIKLEKLLTTSELDNIRTVRDFYKKIKYYSNKKTFDERFPKKSKTYLCENIEKILYQE